MLLMITVYSDLLRSCDRYSASISNSNEVVIVRGRATIKIRI